MYPRSQHPNIVSSAPSIYPKAALLITICAGVLLTVVQLFGGGFLQVYITAHSLHGIVLTLRLILSWLSFLRILHDRRTLWERRPATTLLILYILSQYVAIISVLLEIFYVCTYPRAFSVVSKTASLLRILHNS